MQILIKRVYDSPTPADGLRVLIDRLWPRGLTKAAAAVDLWAKDLAPSKELRTWFSHEDEKFAEFTRRYRTELNKNTPALEIQLTSSDHNTITLLYSAKNKTSNNALVLQAWLQQRFNEALS